MITPSHFICPLSLDMMIEPVVCQDGFSYEKKYIMSIKKQISPITREKINLEILIPNFALKQIIEEYKNNLTNNNNTIKFNNIFYSQFLCPLSLKIMKDPVICQDGFSYERNYIMSIKNPISPMTGQPIDLNILITNFTLKQIIEEYKNNLNLQQSLTYYLNKLQLYFNLMVFFINLYKFIKYY